MDILVASIEVYKYSIHFFYSNIVKGFIDIKRCLLKQYPICPSKFPTRKADIRRGKMCVYIIKRMGK